MRNKIKNSCTIFGIFARYIFLKFITLIHKFTVTPRNKHPKKKLQMDELKLELASLTYFNKTRDFQTLNKFVTLTFVFLVGRNIIAGITLLFC